MQRSFERRLEELEWLAAQREEAERAALSAPHEIDERDADELSADEILAEAHWGLGANEGRQTTLSFFNGHGLAATITCSPIARYWQRVAERFLLLYPDTILFPLPLEHIRECLDALARGVLTVRPLTPTSGRSHRYTLSAGLYDSTSERLRLSYILAHALDTWSAQLEGAPVLETAADLRAVLEGVLEECSSLVD
jgi:hypothetical protein